MGAKNRLTHETNDICLYLPLQVLVIKGLVHSLCVRNGGIQFGEYDIVSSILYFATKRINTNIRLLGYDYDQLHH